MFCSWNLARRDPRWVYLSLPSPQLSLLRPLDMGTLAGLLFSTGWCGRGNDSPQRLVFAHFAAALRYA